LRYLVLGEAGKRSFIPFALASATALVRQGRFTPEAKLDLEYAQAKYPEAKALLDTWPPK